jgi:predicted signal transduction protein with EAL and GGDEF domain
VTILQPVQGAVLGLQSVQVLARAQDALYGARARRHGSFQAYQPNLKRVAERQENMRATDEILSALNERRIFIHFEPVVDIGSRRPAFYECLMRIKRPDGSLLAVNEFIPWAERLGLVRLLDHRVLDLVAATGAGRDDDRTLRLRIDLLHERRGDL